MTPPLNETSRRPGLATSAGRLGARAFWLILTVGAVGFGVQHFALNQFDEEIRAHLEAELQAHYGNYRVAVGSARRLPGEGIEVRGITIRDPRLSGELADVLTVELMMVDCQTSLAEMLRPDFSVNQVVLRRVRLRAARREDGSLTVDQLWPLPKLGPRAVRVIVQHGEIEIHEPTRQVDPLVVFREVGFVVTPQAPPDVAFASRLPGDATLLAFRGTFSCDHARKITVEGTAAPREGLWSLRGHVEGLEVSPELRRAMPSQLADLWPASPELQGRANLEFHASRGSDASAPPRFGVSGHVFDAKLFDSRFPYPLTEAQADFYCDNDGLQVDKLTARGGPAAVRLSGRLDGWTEHSPWELTGRVERLPLDRAAAGALMEDVGDAWDKFSPSGLINADVRLVSDGITCQRELSVECLDVSLAFHRYPYPLHGARGTVLLRDNRITLHDFTALAAGQPVVIEGVIENPGPECTGWVEVNLEQPIPLDNNLLSALDDKSRGVVEKFHPTGMMTFWGRYEKSDPAATQFERRMKIGLHGLSVRFADFRYPVDKIRGVLELSGNDWVFRNLEGQNDTAHITCQGDWKAQPGGGGLLRLDFNARDVPLDVDLEDALKDSARRAWTRLRPRGVMDQLAIQLRYDSRSRQLTLDVRGQKWPPQGIEGRSISVEPVWLPYRVDNVIGAFSYRDGKLEFKGVRGGHGRTTIELDGVCDFMSDGPWSIQLNRLTADRLLFDHQLVAALPRQLGQSIAKLQLTGLVNLDGRVSMSGGPDPDSPVRGDWDVAIDVENGGVDCGIQLKAIRGGLRLAGVYDHEGLRNSGELMFDSAIYQDAQVTQIRGPVWLDDAQIVLGSPDTQVRGQQTGRSLTARVFGGVLMCNGRVDLANEPTFALRCYLEDGDLLQISEELGPGNRELSGKTFGELHMGGSINRISTWRGNGVIRLREADIYRVPVMVAMLSLLSIRQPETTAFTTADMEFQVEGDHVYFDRIDFTGDAISLRGNGDMNFSRKINLQFYAMVGRDEFRIPILRPVLGEASRQFLSIEVLGTLDQPKVHHTAFPGLNETLQQIFPEAAKQESRGNRLWLDAKKAAGPGSGPVQR